MSEEKTRKKYLVLPGKLSDRKKPNTNYLIEWLDTPLEGSEHFKEVRPKKATEYTNSEPVENSSAYSTPLEQCILAK